MLCIRDTEWVKRSGSISFQIGLSTFGILALELALIRWTSAQIRIFAYFNNLVLIGAFLGMGLGVALGRRFPGLVHYVLPSLLLVSIPLAFSESFGMVRMGFPDETISLWGAEIVNRDLYSYISHLSIFMLIICLMVSVFMFAGAPIGYLFSMIPTLRAYSSDLLGSLLGIIVFTLMTFVDSNPPIWFLIGCLPFVWLSKKWISIAACCGILILTGFSIRGAVYSPYNRIDLVETGDRITLYVNRDFHQYIHDFSENNFLDERHSKEDLSLLSNLRNIYDVPFVINDFRKNALIVGAGTGNDVQAALRNGYSSVFSVDIDGKIIELGKRLHPEKPYDHPAVVPIVNDARAFFEQYQGDPFDVVCFGYLDSHAMFSSMSSLRLDNYVYTQEAIHSAWRHVSERGHLSVAFSVYAGQWIIDRLYWTIARATGKEPFVIAHGLHEGATFIVGKDSAVIHWDRMARYPRIFPRYTAKATRITSDDWPFLYIKPRHFPWGYLIVLTAVVLIASVSVPLAFGRKMIGKDFDPTLFLMGAAFLLIETRGITSLSLLFGSTWIVNASIFSGVLTMVLLANLVVNRLRLKDPRLCFVGLFISVYLVCSFSLGFLNVYPLLIRGIMGGLLIALPIGFAGLIVSILLWNSSNATASLGSNLLGAVLGGCLEYLSMFLGLTSLAQLALVIYLLAFLTFFRRKSVTGPMY